MANTTKSKKGRPGVMPAPRRAPNPRTPRPVGASPRNNAEGGDASGEETKTTEDAQATMGQVEQQPKE